MRKLTIDYIKKHVEQCGNELLSTRYINNSTKLLFKCPLEHEFRMAWSTFQRGHRCSTCAGNKKLTFEQVKVETEKDGTVLLSKTFSTISSKLKFKCSSGHEFKMLWGNFQQGYRCPACAGNKRLTIEQIQLETKQIQGYKILSIFYVNNNTKLKFQCPIGHNFWMTWANFKRGQRCSVCDDEKKTSKAEREIQKYVKSLTNGVIKNDRTQIINPITGKNLELDIWIPKLNKAIEYNGEYWHSSEYSKYKDDVKQDQCKELGIDLLIVDEQDYINNKEREMRTIKEFVNETFYRP